MTVAAVDIFIRYMLRFTSFVAALPSVNVISSNCLRLQHNKLWVATLSSPVRFSDAFHSTAANGWWRRCTEMKAAGGVCLHCAAAVNLWCCAGLCQDHFTSILFSQPRTNAHPHITRAIGDARIFDVGGGQFEGKTEGLGQKKWMLLNVQKRGN